MLQILAVDQLNSMYRCISRVSKDVCNMIVNHCLIPRVSVLNQAPLPMLTLRSLLAFYVILLLALLVATSPRRRRDEEDEDDFDDGLQSGWSMQTCSTGGSIKCPPKNRCADDASVCVPEGQQFTDTVQAFVDDAVRRKCGASGGGYRREDRD